MPLIVRRHKMEYFYIIQSGKSGDQDHNLTHEPGSQIIKIKYMDSWMFPVLE